MNEFYLIALVSGFISSFSQILLKKGALKEYKGIVKQYLNPYVIGGYAITFLCMILTMISYKGIQYKFGAVIESLTYIYILFFGRIFVGENITKHKLIGILAIVAGVIVFSLGDII